MRAVIYARYSSDKQNDRSIEDQVALCQAFIAREGLTEGRTYADRALSGASTVDRLALGELRRDARAGAFQVVVAESLDRIARDQEDLAHIFKRLRHLGIEIRTVQGGRADDVHVGIAGLMGSLYLRDLSAKTHRGLQGVVREGLSAGGRSYGYRPAEGRKGELKIDREQADIVVRILTEYVDGRAPRDIAARLNADRIPGPRGGVWNASTIGGSRLRKNGIVNNALYAGRLIWNRQRFEKDPDTGRRISRLNPPEKWITAERPELRIVDEALWQAAQNRKESRSHGPTRTGAPRRYLLSGLLKCGCCGSGYSVSGSDKRGTVIACSRWRESGTCTNRRTLGMRAVEQQLLDGLETHLGDPELVAEYVREWHRATAELEAADRASRADSARRLSDIDRKIAAIITAIEEGLATRAMGERLKALETERELLVGEDAPAAEPANVVTFHPGIVEAYRRRIRDLRTALSEIEDDHARKKLFEKIRALVDKIVIRPGAPYQPVELEIHGEMAGLLGVSEKTGHWSVGSLVAGARNHRYRHGVKVEI